MFKIIKRIWQKGKEKILNVLKILYKKCLLKNDKCLHLTKNTLKMHLKRFINAFII